MKSGDVIFVYDSSLLSKLVRFFDHNGRFSHCCICVNDNNEILEAQYYKKSDIVPFNYAEFETVDLRLTDSQRKRIQELAVTLIGKKYDFIEVLSIFIRNVFDRNFKIINNPKQLICSELVEILLQDICAIPNDKKLTNLTPNELYDYLKSLKGGD